MTVLKKLKLPLYYLKSRKLDGTPVLARFAHSLYIKPEDIDVIDVDIQTDDKKKKDDEKKKDKKKNKNKKGTRRQPGEYSVRLCFGEKSLNKTKQKEIQTELSDALVSKKAHIFFKDLITMAMTNAGDDDGDLKLHLASLEHKKQLYHFFHRSTAKGSILYSIIPDKKIPRRYANKEMIENFIYNVAQVEIAHITPIKSIQATLG
jgi:hypothetical protein